MKYDLPQGPETERDRTPTSTGSGQIRCLSVIRKQQSKMIIDRKRLKRNVPLIIVQIKPHFSHKHSSAPEGSEGK